MRIKAILLGVLALILASTALAYTPTQKINFQNVSDPQRLERLLNDQFAALKDDISGLYFSGTGNFFYVDSNVGSASYTGTDWVHPKATLDSAVALCTANNGDVIFVATGHTENLAAADAVDLDVAGITVIGLGSGADRPKFTYTNANGEFVIGATSVSVYNLQFVPGITSVTKAIDIETGGSNALISGCTFLDSATAADEFLSQIIVNGAASYAGANYVRIVGNQFFSTNATAGATGSAITSTAGITNGMVIKDNFFFGDWDSGAIYSDDINVGMLIEGNAVYSQQTGVAGIRITAASTGIARGNFIYSDTWGALGVTVFDPGSLMCVDNWGTTAIDVPACRIPSSATAGNSTFQDTLEGGLWGGNGITTWPTAAAYANGISIAEVLAYIQDGVRKGSGTAFGTNKSIVDGLGTTGVALVDDALSIAGIIGIPTDADNAVASTSIVSNADGSLYERLEYIQEMGTATYNRNAYNFLTSGLIDCTTGTGWETVATHEVFTVVGTVHVRLMIFCNVTFTDAADGASAQVGFAGATNNLIASTAIATAATLLDAGEFWIDATPTETYGAPSSLVFDRIVGGGIDIGYEVTGAALTAGTFTWYLWWEPISSDGAVTAVALGTPTGL